MLDLADASGSELGLCPDLFALHILDELTHASYCTSCSAIMSDLEADMPYVM